MNFYAMQDNGGVAWSPILGQGNFHKASRFGRVLFAEEGWTPPTPAATAAPGPTVDPASLREAAKKLKRESSTTPAGTTKGPGAAPKDESAAPQPKAAPPKPKAPQSPAPEPGPPAPAVP
jgi:hypothetical protein